MSASPNLVHIHLSEVFTFFFVMLGPLRILAPFAAMTTGRADAESRMVALRATVLATLTVLLASLIGSAIVVEWHVAIGELAVAGGIVFFLVALQIVLDPYSRTARTSDPTEHAPTSVLELTRKLVPVVVTPWGIAAVIFFLTADPEQRWPILAILIGVMALDLLAMLFAGKILRLLAFPLELLETVLSILQVALSVELIVFGIKLIAIQRFGAHFPLGQS